MSTQGPNNPGTATSATWANVNNVFASDNSYSTVSLNGTPTTTAPITITNFGFSIPSGATIDGITGEIEKKVNSTSRNPKDNAVQFVKGGVGGGTNLASASVWPTTDAYSTYGSSSSLSGQTWTDADINASNFGILISGKRDAGKAGVTTYSIDHVRITVDYTAGGVAFVAKSAVIVSQAINRASRW